MAKFELLFVHHHDTAGAHIYKEVDDKGDEKAFGEYIVGSLYLRKTAFRGTKQAGVLTVVIESLEDAAPAKKQAAASRMATAQRAPAKKAAGRRAA